MIPQTGSDLATFQAFVRSWNRNQIGGWPARWHRRRLWPILALQRLGLHLPVRVPLFFGEKMRVLTGETVSSSLIAFGYSEAAITALLCDLVKPDALVVDIGSHFGYEAMLMARLAGSKGIVHAFEPNPEVLAIAGRNLSTYPQVRLHGCALSDSEGTVRFALPQLHESAFSGLNDHLTSSRHVQVTVKVLDGLLAERPRPATVVKCDAEGAEISILRGAVRLIASDLPALILETGMADGAGRSAPRAHEIAAILAPNGYSPFSFEFGEGLSVGPLDTIPFFHASTLYLHRSHPNFASFSAGYRRTAA